jgi:hypothetical protein
VSYLLDRLMPADMVLAGADLNMRRLKRLVNSLAVTRSW